MVFGDFGPAYGLKQKDASVQRAEANAGEVKAALDASERKAHLVSLRIVEQEEEIRGVQRTVAALQELSGARPGIVQPLWEMLLELRQTVKEVDDDRSAQLLAKLANVWPALAGVETHVAFLQALAGGNDCVSDPDRVYFGLRPNKSGPCSTQAVEPEACALQARAADLEKSLRNSITQHAQLRVQLADHDLEACRQLAQKQLIKVEGASVCPTVDSISDIDESTWSTSASDDAIQRMSSEESQSEEDEKHMAMIGRRIGCASGRPIGREIAVNDDFLHTGLDHENEVPSVKHSPSVAAPILQWTPRSESHSRLTAHTS
jgi:hypothetical protein